MAAAAARAPPADGIDCADGAEADIADGADKTEDVADGFDLADDNGADKLTFTG